jgi:uncharacterized protein (DUF488 family)
VFLYSIGYQGKSLKGLCAKLADNAVEVLVDVRERAWSNRPEFRKGVLADGLNQFGIKYIHLKAAGNPFRPRTGLSVQRDLCLEHYSDHLAKIPDVVSSVASLSRIRRPALFCYEADAEECHRGVLITALIKLNPDLIVVYL